MADSAPTRQILGGPPKGLSMGIVLAPNQRLVFISGQIAVDSDGEVVGPGDMGAQARDVFAKIGVLLEEAGGSFAHIVKITAYVTDISRIAEYAAVRTEVFTPSFPASATVEISALIDPALLVEVEAIAALPAS
jgi:enamine deaminase RidA (YjgF/YER057c/UK114 family)